MFPALESALLEVCDFVKANPNSTQEEIRNQIASIRSQHSISEKDFSKAAIQDLIKSLKNEINSLENELEEGYEELYGCAENDVEGAALAIWALNLSHSNHGDDEYIEERVRIEDEYCPLLQLSGEEELPDRLQRRVDEMLDMICDAVERLEAGAHLPV
jgi:septal ring factor EnvC (AmiA/AmiB activator)